MVGVAAGGVVRGPVYEVGGEGYARAGGEAEDVVLAAWAGGLGKGGLVCGGVWCVVGQGMMGGRTYGDMIDPD